MPTVREERTRLESIVQQLQRTIQGDPQNVTAQQSLSGAQAALDRFIQNHRARGDDDQVLEIGAPGGAPVIAGTPGPTTPRGDGPLGGAGIVGPGEP